MNTYFRAICLFLCFALVVVSQAQEQSSGRSIRQQSHRSRGIMPEERIRNYRPNFCTRVSVCLLDNKGNYVEDRPNCTFTEGECMGVQVVSAKPGHLYVFYRQADESEILLFPNKFDKDNRVEAKRTITLPDPSYEFNLRVTPPFGEEALIVLVTEKPLSDAALDHESVEKNAVTQIDLDTLIDKVVEVELREKQVEWAEHSVTITTHAKGGQTDAPHETRRVGLSIGVSEYQDERIPDLHICHTDAQRIAEVMKEQCNLDDVRVLVNCEATRAAVEEAFKELEETTEPGDEIFIYWSGHGATCANTGDEDKEPNGLDEFLVPYNASPEDLEGTVVMDDTLGRWIQALDGRRVVIILDCCYSGGQAADKGIKDAGFGTNRLADGNGATTVRWVTCPTQRIFSKAK